MANSQPLEPNLVIVCATSSAVDVWIPKNVVVEEVDEGAHIVFGSRKHTFGHLSLYSSGVFSVELSVGST